jgi:predicted transcriptional regulator
MTAELERAVKAYQRAITAVDRKREDLAWAIAAAAQNGTRQTEIVRITGYTREHVRRIVKDHT